MLVNRKKGDLMPTTFRPGISWNNVDMERYRYIWAYKGLESSYLATSLLLARFFNRMGVFINCQLLWWCA